MNQCAEPNSEPDVRVCITNSRGGWANVAHLLGRGKHATHILDALNGNLFTRDMVTLAFPAEASDTINDAVIKARSYDRQKTREAGEAAVAWSRKTIPPAPQPMQDGRR